MVSRSSQVPGMEKQRPSRPLMALWETRMWKSATICYFFFKDNEEQNATATAICAILHQLFCAKEGLFQKYALKQIIQHGDNLKVDFETLWQVWISAAYDPSTGDVICILDALDECRQPDRNRLIQELERFYTTYREKVDGRSKLKFLITSRPYGDIKRGFGNMIYEHPTTQLAADDESKIISHEIRMVMDATVDKIVKARRLTNDIGIALKRRLSEVPSTTYLWLHLVLDEIQRYHGGTEKKLLRKINELPETVEDAYEKILERCNKGTRHDAKRLLEIIVAAQRPLTLSEIDVVLEIKTDPDSRSCDDLDLEGANREQWILDTCSLFVSIIDSRIYLIHQTAREFLLRKWNERAATKGWRYSIDLQNAHLALSKLCLVYLHFKDFQRDYQEITLDLVPEEAFLRYSANHWIYHLQQADTIEWQWVNRAAKLCDAEHKSKSVIFLLGGNLGIVTGSRAAPPRI
ncbi:hypothetical protein N7510_007325 [Penicillium lagena]|uniref:uncharacterized protein n=1 Tax=Penicillium lagena TaxID=94218 RepID=UPI00253FD5E8|nr:uncharacterized protein N7510_007325 [Penicillium lagena]KAJ5610606.1 hypothetical protein N7510_007325 [Penicillium lagena]